jgi:hypothetical protein
MKNRFMGPSYSRSRSSRRKFAPPYEAPFRHFGFLTKCQAALVDVIPRTAVHSPRVAWWHGRGVMLRGEARDPPPSSPAANAQLSLYENPSSMCSNLSEGNDSLGPWGGNPATHIVVDGVAAIDVHALHEEPHLLLNVLKALLLTPRDPSPQSAAFTTRSPPNISNELKKDPLEPALLRPQGLPPIQRGVSPASPHRAL